EGHLRDVDAGDEELAPALHVRTEVRLAAVRDGVLLLLQPGVEPCRVPRAEDDDLVLADRELCLDGDAEVLRLRGRRGLAESAAAEARRGRRRARGRDRAGVLLPVLDQPRRAHLI